MCVRPLIVLALACSVLLPGTATDYYVSISGDAIRPRGISTGTPSRVVRGSMSVPMSTPNATHAGGEAGELSTPAAGKGEIDYAR
jgi:hypothetical protein